MLTFYLARRRILNRPGANESSPRRDEKFIYFRLSPTRWKRELKLAQLELPDV
jgi:hypothetical protein